MVSLRTVVLGIFNGWTIFQNAVALVSLLSLSLCLLITSNVMHSHTLMLLVNLIAICWAGDLLRIFDSSVRIDELVHSQTETTIAMISTSTMFSILLLLAVTATLLGFVLESALALVACVYDYEYFPTKGIFSLVIMDLWLGASALWLLYTIDRIDAFSTYALNLGLTLVTMVLFYFTSKKAVLEAEKDLQKAEAALDYERAAQRRLDVTNAYCLRRSFLKISIVFAVGTAALGVAELFEKASALRFVQSAFNEKTCALRSVANFIASTVAGLVSFELVYTFFKEHAALRATAEMLWRKLCCKRRPQGELEVVAAAGNASDPVGSEHGNRPAMPSSQSEFMELRVV